MSTDLEKTALYQPPPDTVKWREKVQDDAPPPKLNFTTGRGQTLREEIAIVLEEELVPGESLDKLSDPENPKLTPDEVIECIAQAGAGLAAAHAKGIIHRDVKPGNILVPISNGNGRRRVTAKVVDFGYGLMLERIFARSRTTTTNDKAGTPYFMSPEQLGGLKNVDRSTDVYSLAATLFTQLGGKLDVPQDPTLPQVTHALGTHGLVNEGNLEALRQSLPARLQRIVDIIRHATHPDPTKRPTMSEFIAALAPFRLQEGSAEPETPSS